jgi:hypothetical protein
VALGGVLVVDRQTGHREAVAGTSKPLDDALDPLLFELSAEAIDVLAGS